VTTAAATAEDACWAKSEELDGWYLEQFKAYGMTVGKLNAEMQAEFVKAGDAIKAKWLERAGDAGKAVLDAYEKM